MTIVAALTLLTGCTASGALENTAEETTRMSHEQASDKQKQDTHPAGSILTLNTVMTSEGVECPAVRGADGLTNDDGAASGTIIVTDVNLTFSGSAIRDDDLEAFWIIKALGHESC